MLQLDLGEQAIWFRRLLSVNNTPMLIETLYFSAARFPTLLALYDGSGDPHCFVYNHYGVHSMICQAPPSLS